MRTFSALPAVLQSVAVGRIAMKVKTSGMPAIATFLAVSVGLGVPVHAASPPTFYNFTTIDVLGASGNTEAFDINSAGKIVGAFGLRISGRPSQGFLYTDGSFITVDVPGASGTSAYGINDAGQIVGTFQTSGVDHGFLYSNGHFITIDVPGARSTDAVGINNAGLIVGTFIDATTFAERGFLATPVFAGTPGTANCHGQSVSALAKQYGGLNNAAA